MRIRAVDGFNCVAGCSSAVCQLAVPTPSHKPCSLQEEVRRLVAQDDASGRRHRCAAGGCDGGLEHLHLRRGGAPPPGACQGALWVGQALQGGGRDAAAEGAACVCRSRAWASSGGRRLIHQHSSSGWRRHAAHREDLLVGAILCPRSLQFLHSLAMSSKPCLWLPDQPHAQVTADGIW